MTFPEQIRELLLAVGLTNITSGIMPATPNATIRIKTLPGLGPSRTHDGGIYEQPRVQIDLRDPDADTAWTNVYIAWHALTKYNITIDGTFYQRIEPIDSPIDLGEDDNKRRMMVFNVQIMKEAQ